MTNVDKLVLYIAGGMDSLFTIGYLLSGQWWKALYWFGATVIAIAVAKGG